MSIFRYIRQRAQSFVYAFKGIGWLIQSTPNARIHLAATVVVVALGIGVKVTAGEWAALLLAMALVWVSEAVNTAIEAVVDLVSPEYHKLAGKAKDLAAGAVLMAAIFAVAVAVAIFGPHLVKCFE